ncbi:MAG: restriction endonuclease subunit S [Pirellulaceae bacterium]
MSVRSKPSREGEAPAEPERDGSELPEGWTSTTIAAVIDDCQPGFASGDKNVEDGVSHLRMNNIGLIGELILDLVRTVPVKLAKPQHKLQSGDVLVCTTNSAKLVGKCAIFDLQGRYAFSNHLTRLRPNREVVDSSYLRWCLWSLWKAGAFDDKCKHWVNQSTIPKDALLDADIPLPPLAEQRRIVGKLELLLGKVSSSQQRLSRVPGLLKRFRQSVLAAACSGKLTADWREERSIIEDDTCPSIDPGEMEPPPFDVPSDWRWSSLDAICSKITDGEHLTPPRVDSGVPILSAKDVRDSDVYFSEAKFVTADIAEKSRQRCNPDRGDILVVSRGATVGRTCRVKTDTVFCLMGSVLLFKPRSQIILPEIIEYCFKTPTGLAALIARSGATAQQAIYIRDMRTFPVPLPPLSEQQEIVRRVEKLFAFADQIEARLRQAQAHIDRLTQSLLAKAFRGELVPTEHALATAEGRDYESASELLQRIKAAPPNSENHSPNDVAERANREREFP